MVLDRDEQLQQPPEFDDKSYCPPPPSYSSVIAEKRWNEQLMELNELLLTLRLSIQDILFMLAMYRHYYQRVEMKSQHLLSVLTERTHRDLVNKSRSLSCDILPSPSKYVADQDALINRMNQTIEYLIREAETSLLQNSGSSTDLRDFSDYEIDESNCKLQQQKKRYLYSQYRLTMTMNELIRYAKKSPFIEDASTANVNNKKVQQKAQTLQHGNSTIHYHYHCHFHHPSPLTETTALDTLEKVDTINIQPKASTSSLPRAVHSECSSRHNTSLSTRYCRNYRFPRQCFRLLFFATLVLTYDFCQHCISPTITLIYPHHRHHQRNSNHKQLWLRRKATLITMWKSRRSYLYQSWILKSTLFLYILRLLSNRK